MSLGQQLYVLLDNSINTFNERTELGKGLSYGLVIPGLKDCNWKQTDKVC